MHIGLLTAGDVHAPTGGNLYNKRLCQWLTAHGDTVSVYTTPHRSFASHFIDNGRPRFRNTVSTIGDSVDILIQDSLVYPSVLQINCQLSVPTVALLHLLPSTVYQTGDGLSDSILTAFHQRVESRYLDSVDGVIHNSELTRQTVNAVSSPAKELVAPPAGDRFDPDPSQIRTSKQTDTLHVLAVGSVCRRKGYDTLVESLRRLPDTIGISLTIVGQTTAEPAFATQIQTDLQQLSIPVTVTGAISDEALATCYATADVLALPSRYESFGMVYLEAMSFGVVPIGTTAGAAASVIGDAGIVVPPNNPDALCSALVSLASDRTKLQSYSRRSRGRYLAHPNWNATAHSIRSFLETIVTEHMYSSKPC